MQDPQAAKQLGKGPRGLDNLLYRCGGGARLLLELQLLRMAAGCGQECTAAGCWRLMKRVSGAVCG